MSSASRFKIPQYQRPYAWELEYVEQLWSDLKEAYDGERDSTNADDYFLGPVVVANDRNPVTGASVSHVVDGQQRLTTLHTLFWVAFHRLSTGIDQEVQVKKTELERLLVTPGDETSLAVAGQDQANFRALRDGTPLYEITRLGKTGRYLRDRLSEWEPTQDLIGFLNYIQNRTVVVLVETDSFASAWDLFIGLNGKGKPLTPSDLIKAFVCGNSTDADAVADIWVQNIQGLETDATSALLDIARVGTGEVGSDAKLFKIFERAWREGEVNVSMLSIGGRTYEHYWRTSLEKVPYLAEGRRALRGLRELRRRDHTPVVLALAARFGAPVVLHADLLRVLEAYQFWMAVRSRRGRERDFTAVASRVFHGGMSETAALAEVRSLITRLAPPADEVRGAVEILAYRSRIMLFVLQQYEEGLRGDIQIEDVQYEHMMPQTPTEYWYSVAGTRDANEYSRIVNNIGNVAPLDANTNIVGRNDDWPIKCRLYAENVPNWLIADIARENPNGWTPAKIRLRAERIAKWAVTERWNLPGLLSRLPSVR